VTQPAVQGSPLSVLIVDADERVRESLAGLVQIGQQCAVVACAGDPAEALELIESYRPDVVLLDPRLPDVDGGRTLARSIRARWPAIRVVVLGLAATLEEAGLTDVVDGCVRKSFRAKELVDAITAAVASTRSPEAIRPAGLPSGSVLH